MTVDHAGLTLRLEPVVVYPADTHRRIELRSEAGRKKAITEQAPGCIENEHNELSLGYGVTPGPDRLGQPANDRIDVFDVVYR